MNLLLQLLHNNLHLHHLDNVPEIELDQIMIRVFLHENLEQSILQLVLKKPRQFI